MTWLAWRQFRTQALAALVCVALAAIGYGISGLSLRQLATDSGYPACVAVNNCRGFLNAVSASSTSSVVLWAGTILLYLAPALIGMFWGAPLIARELASGSFRLLWTQSISRTRWLGVKLLIVGGAAMVTAGLLTLVVTWASAPVDTLGGLSGGLYRLSPVVFGARGIAPIGYAAFALTLGVTIGLLVRRTLPAMAITFAVLVAVQVAVPLWVRPHLQPPVTLTIAVDRPTGIEVLGPDRMRISGGDAPAGAWILSDVTLGPDGREFVARAPASCLQMVEDVCAADVVALHLRQQISYQPEDRFWPFQVYEVLAFLVLSVGLGGFCTWRINRLS